jgi:HIRAN domain
MEMSMSHTVRAGAPLPTPTPPTERSLRTNVHGTVFAARRAVADRVQVGEQLLLVPELPKEEELPAVWVHVHGGDVLGHVPVHVAAWLAPFMLAGGRCQAVVTAVLGPEVESWNRIEIELRRSPEEQTSDGVRESV